MVSEKAADAAFSPYYPYNSLSADKNMTIFAEEKQI